MELIIDVGRKRKIYATDDGGLVVTTMHSNGLKAEEHFDFEKIRKETTLYNQTFPAYLIIAGILFFVFFAGLSEEKQSPNFSPTALITLGTMIGVLILAFWLHRKKIFVLKTSSGSWIRFDIKRNETEISSFVEYLIATRNKFLKFKYGTPNNFMSYDSQYSNFNILLREGVLSQEEYKNNIENLSRTFAQTHPSKVSNQFSQN